MDEEPTETWWMELRLWPVVVHIEAEVLLETRGLPGMSRYQCQWNDLVALWWRLISKPRTLSGAGPKGGDQ